MAKRVLFLVNGLGLGNATRCHAVIEELRSMNCEIAVVTSGNGFWYFKNNTVSEHLFEIPQINYAKRNGRIDILRTLFSAPKMLKTNRQNSALLENIISHFKPQVVVADSVYTSSIIRKFDIPLVHLNNADVVMADYKKHGLPMSVQFQFQAVERMDYLFHKFNSDAVISPSFDPDQPVLHGSVCRVPVIVRPGLKKVSKRSPPRILVMLSGSVFGTKVSIQNTKLGIPINIVGRERDSSEVKLKGIDFIGRVPNSIHYINASNLAVVNGGFSAVSEMFFRRCPMVVIPIPGHSEQYVNAKTIERLGVGLMAEEHELENKLEELVTKSDQFHEAFKRLKQFENGAFLAARRILDL